jgi:hypothetical protein
MTNYTVQKMYLGCDLYGFMAKSKLWDAGLVANLDMICELNRCGRSYMATDPNQHGESIKLLEAVNDKLDYLYFHLRENPLMLCLHPLHQQIRPSSSENDAVTPIRRP